MTFNISTRVTGGYVAMTFLAIMCGAVGYYGISRLSQSLQYVTGPAWNTADGAMEASIGVQAQVMAIDQLISHGGNDATARKLLEDGGVRADKALALTRDSGLRNMSMTLRHQVALI